MCIAFREGKRIEGLSGARMEVGLFPSARLNFQSGHFSISQPNVAAHIPQNCCVISSRVTHFWSTKDAICGGGLDSSWPACAISAGAKSLESMRVDKHRAQRRLPRGHRSAEQEDHSPIFTYPFYLQCADSPQG